MKRSLIIVVFVFLPAIIFAKRQGQAFIDSLLQELPGAKEDTNKIYLLNGLSFAYQTVNPELGIKYGDEGLRLAERLKWKFGIAQAYNSLGVNYDAKSDFDKALEYHVKALSLNEEINNKKEIANSLENMAFTYQNKSDHPKALESNFKALKIFRELEDRDGMASTSGAIGSVYYSERNYEKALEYHFNALKIHKELGNKAGMAGNLGNIGNVYEHQHIYVKALQYDLMAYELFDALGDQHGKERNLGNMGNIYTLMRDYPKALEYDFKALEIAEELNDRNVIATNLGNIGETYLFIVKDVTRDIPPDDRISENSTTNLKRSVDYLNKGITACREIGLLDAIIEFSQHLSEAYTLAGDSKMALENYKLYTTLKDSLYSDENKMKIAQMGDKYEKELKERDAEISKLTADKKRNERNLFIVVFGMIALVVGFWMKNNLWRKA